MVSDIYFPISPSPYPAFYPISYPLNYYPQSPPRPIQTSHSMPVAKARSNQVFDANRNHIVPYYYSETANCMPAHDQRHTLTNYAFNERQLNRYSLSPRIQTRVTSADINLLPHTHLRPHSVLENCKSPIGFSRPSSVMPISDQFRPASAFFQKEIKKHIPDWKLNLLNDLTLKTFRNERLKQCRIPNCKCNFMPAVNPTRFSEAKTLPTESEKSLKYSRNLSLPSLKFTDDGQNFDKAERDTVSKPITEEHLGYV